MGKMTARIFDSTFTPFSKSASLREENKDVEPTYFKWVDGNDHPNDGKPVFYTDNEILRRDSFEPNAVAWLLEPRCLRPENYEAAQAKAHLFKVILSYDMPFLKTVPNERWYPFGGSSILLDKWGVYPKSEKVCMFLSKKDSTFGHMLRRRIAKRFKNDIDVFGEGVGKPIKNKFSILKNYSYCVVVESCAIDWYFSEKLIDVLSVGTIPIYYNHPSIIENDFDELGFCTFMDLNELSNLLDKLDRLSDIGFNETSGMKIVRQNNMETAKWYRICEDWIYENQQDLFK